MQTLVTLFWQKNCLDNPDHLTTSLFVMNNHAHLLLEPLTDQWPLAKLIQSLNLRYSHYYKKRYTHIGHLFQDRFKNLLVDRDTYLLACGAYIELRQKLFSQFVKDQLIHPTYEDQMINHTSSREYCFP